MALDLSKKEYDYIIFSHSDHYAGIDAHGTTQMFKYMKNDLGLSCALLLTGEKVLGLEHSYLISDFMSSEPMSIYTNREVNGIKRCEQIFDDTFRKYDIDDSMNEESINLMYNFYGPNDVRHILSLASKKDSQFNTIFKEFLYFHNAAIRLPKHKAVIYPSKNDGGGAIYSFVRISQKINKAKIFYYGMVHDAYTGKCSYPQWYGCDKYKYKEGCYNCIHQVKSNERMVLDYLKEGKALNQPYSMGHIFAEMSFSQMRDITDDYSDRIVYLASSDYSKNQAKESFLFRNADTRIARLKTLPAKSSDTEGILHTKAKNREKLFKQSKINEHAERIGVEAEDINVLFWSCMDASQERKGIKEFIDICHLLARKLSNEEVSKMLLVFGGDAKKFEPYREALPKSIPYLTTGKMENHIALEVFSASDLFCCTTLEDAGPRTVSESLYAGTPVVSFDACIAKDILNGNNGQHIKTADTYAFADYIVEYVRKSRKEKETMFVESSKSFVDFYDEEKMKKQWIKALEI